MPDAPSEDEGVYRRVRELFEAARELPPEQREALLKDRCGDDAPLRERVERLLACHDEGSGVLDPLDQLEQVTLSEGLSEDDPEAWEAFLTRLREKGPPFDRFLDRGEVARGGMGVIRRVRDENLRRTLAMKVILTKQGQDPVSGSASVGRFLEEAQVTAQLDHPGIVPVHDIGLDDESRVYFTMKFVRGEDLRLVFDRVRDPDDDDWNETRVLGTLLRVCEAMAYAHEKGVIHRDLKPANVMVGKYGQTYVMDWGLSKLVGREARTDRKDLRIRPQETSTALSTEREQRASATPDSPLVTMDGDVVGTPAYMAPEQAQGRLEQVGPHSDVYALGAMLYHLLAGRTPYVEPGARISPRTILGLVTQGPPVPIHKIRKDCPAELMAICEKAMARGIQDRYPTMLELAKDLRAYLENRVVAAYESGPIAELKKWVVRNKGITTTAAAAVVVIASLSAWSYQSIRSERDVAAANEQQARAERQRADQNAAEAERRAAEAETARRQVLRLADVKRLEDLTTEMAELWPAHPEQVPGIKAWLERARALLARRAEHDATLAGLRSRGKPLVQLAGLEEAASERARDHDFGEDTESQWWHDTLRDLVVGLDRLSGEDVHGSTIRAMEVRLEFAENIQKRSITYYMDEWNEAIASISDPDECPAYAGLRITPQLGLVPVGQDPESGLWEFWHTDRGEASAG